MAKSPQFVGAAVVAEWLNLSPRRVRELAAAGVIVKQKRDQYDLKASVRAYATHVREQAAGRVGIDPTNDIVAANLRLKESNARLADLRYQRESGSLVERALLHGIWDPIMLRVRRFVMGLPGIISFEIPVLTSTDRSTIERICRDGLHDCALERGFDFDAKASDDQVPDEEGEKDD
jgi:terminase small subunit / prophage DNA-packing protein